MTIGAGIFLAAVGAVLTFAVNASVAGLDIHVVGVVLMLAGVVGVAVELAVLAPRRRGVRAVGPVAYSTVPAATHVTTHVVPPVVAPVEAPVVAPLATTVVPDPVVVTETRW